VIDHEDHWTKTALCREIDDPSIFFPTPKQKYSKADLARIDDAIAVCEYCPVRVPCHAYAEATRSVGIWAGKLRLTTARTPPPAYPGTPN
jgi:hypothetical protein